MDLWNRIRMWQIMKPQLCLKTHSSRSKSTWWEVLEIRCKFSHPSGRWLILKVLSQRAQPQSLKTEGASKKTGLTTTTLYINRTASSSSNSSSSTMTRLSMPIRPTSTCRCQITFTGSVVANLTAISTLTLITICLNLRKINVLKYSELAV